MCKIYLEWAQAASFEKRITSYSRAAAVRLTGWCFSFGKLYLARDLIFVVQASVDVPYFYLLQESISAVSVSCFHA